LPLAFFAINTLWSWILSNCFWISPELPPVSCDAWFSCPSLNFELNGFAIFQIVWMTETKHQSCHQTLLRSFKQDDQAAGPPSLLECSYKVCCILQGFVTDGDCYRHSYQREWSLELYKLLGQPKQSILVVAMLCFGCSSIILKL
jgi:hypothetical protein